MDWHVPQVYRGIAAYFNEMSSTRKRRTTGVFIYLLVGSTFTFEVAPRAECSHVCQMFGDFSEPYILRPRRMRMEMYNKHEFTEHRDSFRPIIGSYDYLYIRD